MKSLVSLIFLCLALSVSIVHAQSTGEEAKAKPFHISSRNSAFGVQGEFEGTYRVTKSSVEVEVTKGTLYVSEHCPYQGRRRINYIKFGLGNRSASTWKMENSAVPFYLNVIMSPRDEYSLSELHFSLPTEGTIDLTKRWLVLEIQEDALDLPSDQDMKGYAFVHSCEYISSNPGDDVRAQIKQCQK